ncbi:ribose-phosphate diphosphokinase [Kribbella sp. NPDC056345]|uniref:ribose-phosphate diphosphokinase n=1 Tax=Kribbella sp. NPDC056345 TaxID=3345789 RepID=UPI0035E2CDB8
MSRSRPLMSCFSVPRNTSEFADRWATRTGAKSQDYERLHFASDEIGIVVPDDVGATATIFVGIGASPAEIVVEVLLLADALSRQGVQDITCVFRYLPYSRSNRLDRQGIALGAKAIIAALESSPISRFIVFDLHSREVLGFFSKPVQWLPTLHRLSDLTPRLPGEIVVSPDRGRYDDCVTLANRRSSDLDLLIKIRRDDSGSSELVAGARTDVRGRSVLLFDDEIWSGQTITHAAEALLAAGAANLHYVTVYDFSTDETKRRLLDEVGFSTFTSTDLVNTSDADFGDRYQVVDVTSILADYVDRE